MCFDRHGSEAAYGGPQRGGKMLFAVDDFSTRGPVPGHELRSRRPARLRSSHAVRAKVFQSRMLGAGQADTPLSTAASMILGLDGTGGTIAGGDHESTVTQPCVEFGPRIECPYLRYTPLGRRAERVRSVGNRAGCKLGSDTETVRLYGHRDGGDYRVPSSAKRGGRFRGDFVIQGLQAARQGCVHQPCDGRSDAES